MERCGTGRCAHRIASRDRRTPRSCRRIDRRKAEPRGAGTRRAGRTVFRPRRGLAPAARPATSRAPACAAAPVRCAARDTRSPTACRSSARACAKKSFHSWTGEYRSTASGRSKARDDDLHPPNVTNASSKYYEDRCNQRQEDELDGDPPTFKPANNLWGRIPHSPFCQSFAGRQIHRGFREKILGTEFQQQTQKCIHKEHHNDDPKDQRLAVYELQSVSSDTRHFFLAGQCARFGNRFAPRRRDCKQFANMTRTWKFPIV